MFLESQQEFLKLWAEDDGIFSAENEFHLPGTLIVLRKKFRNHVRNEIIAEYATESSLMQNHKGALIIILCYYVFEVQVINLKGSRKSNKKDLLS